jgi:hypothetical protein
MYVLVVDTDACIDCPSTNRAISGFTSSTPIALAHILAGIYVDKENLPRHGHHFTMPSLGPASTNSCLVVDETEDALLTSIVPADGLLDISHFAQAKDIDLMSAAITQPASDAVNAYFAERERVLKMFRDEQDRQEAEAKASQDRDRNFVTLVKFPNPLLALRDGAPGDSHHRIPVDDLYKLAATIHDVRDTLAGSSLCIRLGRVRYELLLQEYNGKTVCVCNACVKARCTEVSRRLNILFLERRVRDL